MQVVSDPSGNPKVHFEAPPANALRREMDRFFSWFNHTAPNGPQPLPALPRAGIAHLNFVSLHPFEDGNGRIGRALSKQSLSQCLGYPTLIALSHTIAKNRPAYYKTLEEHNKGLNITAWLVYFAQTILDAQRYTQRLIDFLIEQTKLYDRLCGQLNPRQEKARAHILGRLGRV